MDLLDLAHPWVLVLVVPAWTVILAATRRRGNRQPGAAARAALALLATGLLLVALAEPSIRTARGGLKTVCIVEDVSPSMTLSRSDPAPAEALARCAALMRGARVARVRFDARAHLAVAPDSPEARRLTSAEDSHTAAGLQSAGTRAGTDLAAGLRQAAAVLPETGGLVLLYTDARETQGDALRAAAQLAGRGIQVHALEPALAAPPDVRVVAVTAPPQAAPGQTVPIQVRVAANIPAGARVRLERRADDDDQPRSWERNLRIDPYAGATLLFEDTASGAGAYTYTAEVSSRQDSVPQNNRASCLVQVGRRCEVLYIHAGPAPGQALEWLRDWLPAAVELSATTSTRNVMPPTAGRPVVILDNVPAWSLGREAARRLANAVTHGGLGLLVLGGDAGFSCGGYADSPLEAALPVTSRTGERPPTEIVLVLDASGSMNEVVGNVTKLTLAKQAVLALRAALGDPDRVGLVAFAGEPTVLSPLMAESEWGRLSGRLLGLQAGGGTRITPALTAALGLFEAADPRGKAVRHVLFLSDGRSRDFDLPRLISRFRRARISLSVVATGPDADAERLGRLAGETGGRLYATADFARLAESFFKDLAWIRGQRLWRKPSPVAWGEPEPVWPRIGGPLPHVAAMNLTRAKQPATVHWAAAPGDDKTETPLLATWHRGLGKVAAMPWPVSHAAGEWLAGGLLGQYLVRILAWLQGPAVPEGWSARIVAQGGRRRLRVKQRAASLDPQRPAAFAASVFVAGAAEPRTISLTQVAPGTFEADLGPQSDKARLVVAHRHNGSGPIVRLPLPGLPPREYECFGLDRERLEAIVRAGGGRVHKTPESLRDVVARLRAPGRTPVGIYLVWAAAAVALAQVVLRLAGRL